MLPSYLGGVLRDSHPPIQGLEKRPQVTGESICCLGRRTVLKQCTALSGPSLACVHGWSCSDLSDDAGPIGAPARLRGAGLGAMGEAAGADAGGVAEGQGAQWKLMQVPLPPLLLNLQLHLSQRPAISPRGNERRARGSESYSPPALSCHSCPVVMPPHLLQATWIGQLQPRCPGGTESPSLGAITCHLATNVLKGSSLSH